MVGKLSETPIKKILSDEAKNASIQVLVSPNEGWDSHVMRVLEVEKDGYTPKHQHPWPHINYIIEGQGKLQIGDTIYPVEKGSYAFVPQDTIHQFKNVGTEIFKFICIVPKEGHK